MAASDLIRVPDYNDIRDKISQVMTNGSGTYGYGQALNANAVAVGNFVTKAQWDALRYDIINALLHQTGSVPEIASLSVGDEIAFGDQQPNRQYSDLASIARTNRFQIGSNQYSIETLATRTQDVLFNVTLQTTVTVSFNDADRARWFFNSGGKIRLNSSFEDTLGTDQSYSWTVLTSNTGTPTFGAETSPVGFYSLTNQDQIFFTYSVGGIYNQNSWRILVKSDVADNSNGGASQIIFTVQWVDSYADLMDVGPGDQVSGRMTLNVSMLKPTGVLYPGQEQGSFSVLPPSGTVISQFQSNFSLPFPVIRSFYSIPNPSNFGSPATLQWRTRNSIYTWIEGFGRVPNSGPFSSQSGELSVLYPRTRTYILHASNALGEVTQSRTLVINPAPGPVYTLTVSPRDYVNEGENVTFTLETQNVPNGTVVGYTLSGISSSDISGEPLSGSFTVSNNIASVTYTISADLVTEPRETLTMTLNGGLALPISIRINDTSKTPIIIPSPTVTVTSNVNSVAANTPIVFTVSTTNATLVYSNGLNLSSITTTKNISGTIPIGEVIERPPSVGSFIYVVTAIGPGGTTTATTAFSVTVPAPPPLPPPPPPPIPPPPRVLVPRTVTVELTNTGGIFGGIFGSLFGSDPTWTVPAGITSVDYTLIGAGAGGSSGSEGDPNLSGGGGGGSGGIRTGTMSVTPGSQIRYRVGRGGAGAVSGSNGSGGVQGGFGGSTYFGNVSITGGAPSPRGLPGDHYNLAGPAGPGGTNGSPGQSVRQNSASSNTQAGGAGGGVPGYSTGGAGGTPSSAVNFSYSSRSIPNSRIVTYPAWNSTMNAYAVWDNNLAAGTYSRTVNIEFPFTGQYTFTMQVDNSGSIQLNGTTILSTSNNFAAAPVSTTISVNQGINSVTLIGINSGAYGPGNPGGVAMLISGTGSPANLGENGKDGVGPGAGGGGGAGGKNNSIQGSGGNGSRGIIYVTYVVYE